MRTSIEMLARFLIRFDAGLAWIERYLVAVVLFVSLGLAVGLWVGYVLGYDRGRWYGEIATMDRQIVRSFRRSESEPRDRLESPPVVWPEDEAPPR
jgi:hypothetical protein